MNRFASLYRNAFIGNQAGNSSVGYVLLAAAVGVAGITSFSSFGDAAKVSIADKAASGAVAGPVGGAGFAAEGDVPMEVGIAPSELGSDANAGEISETAPGPSDVQVERTEDGAAEREPAVVGETTGAQTETPSNQGGSFWSGATKLGLSVAAGFGAKALLTSSLLLPGGALVGPIAAGALAGAALTFGLDGWRDLHPASYNAVTSWVNDSFIGDIGRAVSDSFVGDAFRWVTGDNFVGNTLTGLIGGAWNTAATALRGGLTALTAVAETGLNISKFVGMGIADVLQLDRLFGDEFDDYSSLWSYPATSLFWNGTQNAAANAWRYAQRIFRADRPDAKRMRAVANDEPKPLADGSWPYDMQVGDQTSDLESVIRDIGIDPSKADFSSLISMTFVNDNGGSDMVAVVIEGNDADGYMVAGMFAPEGAEEPQTLFTYSATADELDEFGENLVFHAAEEAGVNFDNYQDTLVEQSYSQVDDGKSQKFAMLSMDASGVMVQSADLDLENASGSSVPSTNSYWRFEMVDDGAASEDQMPAAVFELVEAQADQGEIPLAAQPAE